jgi:hypothetical protein
MVPKIILRPMAAMAYTAPKRIPFTRSWKKISGDVIPNIILPTCWAPLNHENDLLGKVIRLRL